MFWVKVCNAAADWVDYPTASSAAAAANAAERLGPEAHSAVLRDAGLLLRVFAARYLDVPLPREDAAELSRWIAAVTLRTLDPADRARALSGTRAPRPLEVIAGRQPGLAAPFEALLSTALVQFVATDATAHARVHRCHGILRFASTPSLYPPEWENRFADRAGIGAAVAAGQTHQCGVLLFSDRGGRYCSKACANASFAARKIAAEPAYFAAKQGRYRARRVRELAASRRRPEALVFLD
jgi:hypothetical protein